MREERQLGGELVRAEQAARRNRQAAERAARKAAPVLPRAGEPGPAAGRNHRPLRVQAHRATSATLAVAYPFLAEAGLGGEGVLIGSDAFSRRSLVFDPWVLYERGVITNPNVAVAGEIGTGKSALLKSLVTRSLCFHRRAYVPGDPKGEWTAVALAAGGAAIELGLGMPARINPLDAGSRPAGLDDAVWRADVRARRLVLLTSVGETLLRRALQPVEHTSLAAALDAVTADADDPILPQVVQAMLDPDPHRDPPAGVDTVEQLRSDGRASATRCPASSSVTWPGCSTGPRR